MLLTRVIQRRGEMQSSRVLRAAEGPSASGALPKNPDFVGRYHSSLRSFQFGLVLSIKPIFRARLHTFSCVSRAIAATMSANSSKYTRRLTLYFVVKALAVPSLCS